MAYIYLCWDSIDDHLESFDDYQELFQTYVKEEVKVELDYVMDVILAFEWKDEQILVLIKGCLVYLILSLSS